MTISLPVPSDTAAAQRDALHATLVAAGDARVSAEKHLRQCEHTRHRVADAMERDLHPMTMDEAGRARLRADYAAATADVGAAQAALDRACRIEQAAATLAAAIADDALPAARVTATAIADVIVMGRAVERPVRGRAARVSARPARRAVQRRDIPPRSA